MILWLYIRMPLAKLGCQSKIVTLLGAASPERKRLINMLKLCRRLVGCLSCQAGRGMIGMPRLGCCRVVFCVQASGEWWSSIQALRTGRGIAPV